LSSFLETHARKNLNEFSVFLILLEFQAVSGWRHVMFGHIAERGFVKNPKKRHLECG
jgi:hypothetical protein